MTFVRLHAALLRQPRGLLLLEAILLVFALGIIDWVTGWELTLFPIYSIPILLTTWLVDRKAGIFIALLSAIIWWSADTAAGHPYSRPWIGYWDATARFIFFLSVVIGVAALKARRDERQARIDLLERSQQLEHEIISISEREQQRIGHDLHDGLCQYLAAIGFAASALKRDLDQKAAPEAAGAGEIAMLLRNAVIQARDVARGLSPVDASEGGLESALDELAANTARLTGMDCEFGCDEAACPSDNATAIHLFRIAQEALSNATKHGKATRVAISLKAESRGYSLRVSDNGRGFDPLSGKGTGMGLNIMRYRARTIGGSLKLESVPGGGTTVSCEVTGAKPG